MNKPLAYMRQHGVPDKVAAAFAASAPTYADMGQLLWDSVDAVNEAVSGLLNVQEADELEPATAPSSAIRVCNKLTGPFTIKLKAAAGRLEEAATAAIQQPAAKQPTAQQPALERPAVQQQQANEQPTLQQSAAQQPALH